MTRETDLLTDAEIAEIAAEAVLNTGPMQTEEIVDKTETEVYPFCPPADSITIYIIEYCIDNHAPLVEDDTGRWHMVDQP